MIMIRVSRFFSLALPLALALVGAAAEVAAQGMAEVADPAAATSRSQNPAVTMPGGESGRGTYPVAARDLDRGEVLDAVDVELVELEAEAAPRGVAPASIVGWRTRRMIAKGEPLLVPAVAPPDLVKGGETVHAIYQDSAVSLRVTGTAAGSAAMGERVLVRIDARRRLEGVVIGPALVKLDLNGIR